MSDAQLHLWDRGALRVVPSGIDTGSTGNVVALLDHFEHDGRMFHPVSCLSVPGPSCMYICPANEETVIDAALFHWRARPQYHQHASDGGIARYHTAYTTRLAILDESLAMSDSLDTWLAYEVFEGFVSLHESVVGFHAGISPRRTLLARMIADITALPERPKNIVAIGSGFGKFLLPLKHALPDIHFCGVEPSPAGIEITRRAAARFNIDVELYQGTIADAAAQHTKRFDLAFTHSVVVQIPEDSLKIVQQIGALTKRWIHLYEHFTEMLGSTRRDALSLYYLTNIARYETGCLLPIANANGRLWHMRHAVRIGAALNPFEEPSFVQLELVHATD